MKSTNAQTLAEILWLMPVEIQLKTAASMLAATQSSTHAVIRSWMHVVTPLRASAVGSALLRKLAAMTVRKRDVAMLVNGIVELRDGDESLNERRAFERQ